VLSRSRSSKRRAVTPALCFGRPGGRTEPHRGRGRNQSLGRWSALTRRPSGPGRLVPGAPTFAKESATPRRLCRPRAFAGLRSPSRPAGRILGVEPVAAHDWAAAQAPRQARGRLVGPEGAVLPAASSAASGVARLPPRQGNDVDESSRAARNRGTCGSFTRRIDSALRLPLPPSVPPAQARCSTDPSADPVSRSAP
jgi:hypothetical protein